MEALRNKLKFSTLKEKPQLKCPKCGRDVTVRKISLNKVKLSCKNPFCRYTWIE